MVRSGHEFFALPFFSFLVYRLQFFSVQIYD